MTTFVIKLVAIITMLIDHVGATLSADTGWGLISPETDMILRSIGRIAFPIFCFCLVNGFSRTSNRENYQGRLFLFAAISQLPYTLAFNFANHMTLETMTYGEPNYFEIFPERAWLLIVLFALYWFLQEGHRFNRNVAYFGLALFVSTIDIQLGNMVLLSQTQLNIGYTLATGLLILTCLESLNPQPLSDARPKVWEGVLRILLTAGLIACFWGRNDYDYQGLLLIVILYVARSQTWYQLVMTALWAAMEYGFPPNPYTWGACVAGLFMVLYNQKKGPSMRAFFYWFYPVHLLILGLFNCYMRLR